MKSNTLNSQPTKQLKTNLTLLKVMSLLISISSLALIGICVYGMLTKENISAFIALMVVGISCLAILPLQLINIKRISTELKSRKEQDKTL
ncbi:hypothetical protein [Psychroflexus tropicus]|uniref:hypothetical protein n=1 Tax=Psychroflexus tropicus TaxID=197345 RepID=UPI00035CDE96|nr:hypothetical protein [Psychroflexus tropicus]